MLKNLSTKAVLDKSLKIHAVINTFCFWVDAPIELTLQEYVQVEIQ